ncbi:MAG: cysteine desulfurase CsdA [Candidatus Marinimicrobia bacterium]|nr:cysteine desulfurase CsdA [Candidatus Neomarinimicrobiota bacterium]
MINTQEIRKQFPIINLNINRSNLIYFDNGATTQNPQNVIDTEKEYYEKMNANVHRGAHFLSSHATEKFEESRKSVQSFINAKSVKEIVFTKGTTESINLVANGFRSILKKDDEVLITEMEHHSNIVPWQICCKYAGAKLRVVPVKENGDLDMVSLKSMLNNKTKLVALTHISNALGTINPIEDICKLSHSFGAKILIDGAQAISHIKVDVQKLNVDFYCFSSHKMYGSTGVGVLYGKEELLNDLPPYQSGGEMIKDVSFEKTTYADLPYKFEAGTPNIAGVISLKSSIDFICKIGIDNIKNHENTLLNYATLELKKIKDLQILGTSKNKSGIISFNINSLHAYDIGVLLDKMGIAIRTGHHCAQPLMKRFNIAGTARISFAVYNTKDEIEKCIAAIKKSKKMLL